MKATIANTIATAPKPTFVKGVTFLLRPDRFFVVVVVVVVVVPPLLSLVNMSIISATLFL